MNPLILALVALSFVGCASSTKQETSAPTAEATQSSTSVPETKAVKKTLKKSAKVAASKAESEIASDPGSGQTVKCNSGSDKRILEIKPTERKGCELHYTKMEATQTVATQVQGNDKCIEIQDRIKGKLEAIGFNCS